MKPTDTIKPDKQKILSVITVFIIVAMLAAAPAHSQQTIGGTAATNKVLIVNGFTGQSVNLMDWQVNGTTLSFVNSTGSFTMPTISLTGSTSGTILIQPQATAGSYNFNLPISAGTSGQVLTSAGGGGSPMTWTTPSGSGTVTTASVVSANGFAGTVATATTTPAITLTTTITGMLKGNGTAISAATAGTDFVLPSGNITGSAGSVTNAVTFNNGGSGAVSGTTFNGSSAITVSYNTIGASPTAGNTSLITTGTITTGTWNATDVAVSAGGTGQSTLTAHGVVIGEGASAVAVTAAGTAGQLLQSGGASADPSWVTFSGMANPMTTQGDIIYENATPAPARLPGSAGLLHSTGAAAPTWGSVSLTADVSGILPTANGGMGASMTAGAIGAIPYSATTTTYGTLADVATGSYLASGGVGVAPQWIPLATSNAETYSNNSTPFSGSYTGGISTTSTTFTAVAGTPSLTLSTNGTYLIIASAEVIGSNSYNSASVALSDGTNYYGNCMPYTAYWASWSTTAVVTIASATTYKIYIASSNSSYTAYERNGVITAIRLK